MTRTPKVERAMDAANNPSTAYDCGQYFESCDPIQAKILAKEVERLEAELLDAKETIRRLQFMLDNGLGDRDIKRDDI